MTGATCDASVLVAALLPWHPGHEPARLAVHRDVDTLIARVLAETFSTLTRLPEPFRASPSSVVLALRRLERRTVAIRAGSVLPTLESVAAAGRAGGATYDALIAATATQHGLTLVTNDRRARPVYDALGAEVRFLA